MSVGSDIQLLTNPNSDYSSEHYSPTVRNYYTTLAPISRTVIGVMGGGFLYGTGGPGAMLIAEAQDPPLLFGGEAEGCDAVAEFASEENAGSEFANLASEMATKHILDTHMPPGLPDKSLFPSTWSPAEILHSVSDIVTDPSSEWAQQTGRPGALLTRAGSPVRYTVDGVRNGLVIRVVVQPGGSGIITAFPIK